MSFDTLGLSDKVVEAVKAVGYATPTPIQAEAIPHVLARRDVLGLAQTGTGKTASFTLPMLTLLEQGRARARMPRTLILEPTRELAAQVAESFERYGVNHRLNIALLIGGVSFDEQDKKITRGADVLIATPGRLLDHHERGRLLLTGVEILVIDEADRMLDMGFIPDIERIVKLFPRKPQTLFFSATMPPEISRLVGQFLQEPVRVEVARPATPVDTIAQRLVTSDAKPAEKRATLRRLLDGAENLTNAIIFCNRKRDVATLHRSLERHGYSAGALHGDMDQHARLRTLDSFRENKITLLVASDVAARGLDIPAVSHIFNFDVPTHAEDYVHRIGRTGRAGRSGTAYTIVTRDDAKYATAIEKLIGGTIELHGEPAAQENAAPRAAANKEQEARRPRGRSSRRREREEEPRRGAPPQGRERRPNDRAAQSGPSAPPSRRDREPRQQQPRHPVAQEARVEPQRRTHREHYGSESERERIGFGDQIPAFLMRPVRAPKHIEIEAADEA